MTIRRPTVFTVTSAGGAQRIDLDYRYDENPIRSFTAVVSGSASLLLTVGSEATVNGTLTTVETTVSVWDNTANLAESIEGSFMFAKFTAVSGGTWDVAFTG